MPKQAETKLHKQFDIPIPPVVDSPFEKVNAQWFFKDDVYSKYAKNKAGFRLGADGIISAKSGNLVNYDAVVSADGTADYPDIQGALDAGAKSIFIREGKYTIDKTITFSTTNVETSIEYYFVGEGHVDIETSGNFTTLFDITIDSNGGVLFENLSITGGGTSGVNNGIYATNSKNLIINKCIIQNFGEYNIRLQDSADCIISNNKVLSGGLSNVFLERNGTATGGSLVTNNNIAAAQEHGIVIEGSKRNKITNNTIITNGTKTNDTYSQVYLVADTDNSTRNVITGNVFYSTSANKPKYGIRENDANQNYNLIANNIVEDAVTANISLQGANSINADNISI